MGADCPGVTLASERVTKLDNSASVPTAQRAQEHVVSSAWTETEPNCAICARVASADRFCLVRTHYVYYEGQTHEPAVGIGACWHPSVAAPKPAPRSGSRITRCGDEDVTITQ